MKPLLHFRTQVNTALGAHRDEGCRGQFYIAVSKAEPVLFRSPKVGKYIMFFRKLSMEMFKY